MRIFFHIAIFMIFIPKVALASPVVNTLDGDRISSVSIHDMVMGCFEKSKTLNNYNYCACSVDFYRKHKSFPKSSDLCSNIANKQPVGIPPGFGMKASFFEPRRMGSASITTGYANGIKQVKKDKHRYIEMFSCVVDVMRMQFVEIGRNKLSKLIEQYMNTKAPNAYSKDTRVKRCNSLKELSWKLF